MSWKPGSWKLGSWKPGSWKEYAPSSFSWLPVVCTSGAILTAGKSPIITAGGRLADGPTPLAGTKVYYVADASGGSPTRKLTFQDGILISET